MATQKLIASGYGQVELNQVAFRRDGRIEAQCAPATGVTLENGMLVRVDNVARQIKLTGADLPLAIVYTAELNFDERKQGLKHYRPGLTGDERLPRLGYLATGDKFTTNAVQYDDSTFATLAAIKTALASGLYGKPTSAGYIELVASKPSGLKNTGEVLLATAVTTMPDGQPAIKFQVL